jgi:hypothetical protein
MGLCLNFPMQLHGTGILPFSDAIQKAANYTIIHPISLSVRHYTSLEQLNEFSLNSILYSFLIKPVCFPIFFILTGPK